MVRLGELVIVQSNLPVRDLLPLGFIESYQCNGTLSYQFSATLSYQCNGTLSYQFNGTSSYRFNSTSSYQFSDTLSYQCNGTLSYRFSATLSYQFNGNLSYRFIVPRVTNSMAFRVTDLWHIELQICGNFKIQISSYRLMVL